jgi:LacI family transcriptional regulator
MSPRARSNQPTLSDVAAAAGVSVPTVSQALGGKGRISREARERIQQIASDLGYSRPIRGRDPFSVMLTLTDKRWSYTWGMNQRLIHAIERRSMVEGREVVILPIFEADDPVTIADRVARLNADSVFSIHYANEEIISLFERARLPLVLVMNNNFQERATSVCVDDYRGAYEAGVLLAEARHKRFAYLSMRLSNLDRVRTDRLVGFRAALEERGFELPEAVQPICDAAKPESVDNAVDALLATNPRPTAWYIMDDYLGVRVRHALERRSVKVPQEVSLIASGDVLDFREPYLPELSTVAIEFDSMGQVAAELMLRSLDASDDRSHEVLKVRQHYVDRGTVAPVST